jgi:hypothetical protein
MKKLFTLFGIALRNSLKFSLLFILLLFTGYVNTGWGQINISPGTTVTESFTIGTSATATLPTNWKADKNTTARLVGTYSSGVTATEQRAGNTMSSSATNGIYNYAAGDPTSATDRCIGWISSSSATKSGNLYAYLKNNGSSSIASFTISYGVEKYRNGSNAAGFSIQLYYSTDGSTWTSAGSNFLTSFSADADNNGYASAPGTTVNVTNQTLTLTVAAGTNIYFAWNYSVTSGTTTSNAQGLGIDDVSITANAAPTPTLTIANNGSQPGAGSIYQGSTNNILQKFTITEGNTAAATLNQITVPLTGNYQSSDISTLGLKLWANTSGTFGTGNISSQSSASSGSGETVTFGSLSYSIPLNGVRYFWVTADISGTANVSNTINASGLTTSNFTFASGTPTGSVSACGTQTIAAALPVITLANGTAPVTSPSLGTNNVVLYRVDVTVATTSATLNTVQFTTAGGIPPYVASDLTNLKIWYHTNSSFTTGTPTQIGSSLTSGLDPGTHDFTGLSQSFPIGTNYIFLTADLPCSGVSGHQISVDAITTSSLSFASGTPTGSSFTGSGTLTFQSATPVNATSFSATNGNTNSVVSWTAPTGCYDEIMIVASTGAISTAPSGNGSAYTANTTFGTGGATSYDGGYVVYKGTTSSQTISGLTNGTKYNFKIFTRYGTSWSSGADASATPVYQTSATDYFKSKGTGNWNSTGTWQASSDNSTWNDATLVPDNNANTILIQNTHTVTVNSSVTVDQVVIQNGGILSFTSGTITVNNGTGDDITIENGGVFNLGLASTAPSFNTGATARIKTGGILRVSASGLTGNGAGVNLSNFVYENASILEYTLTSSFSSSGVTYFPNADANTIPIFRITSISGSTPGGGSATVINGVIEVNSPFTWAGAGTKTFRNGIIGTSDMSQGTTGQWIISGTTAIMGGTGALVLGTNGLVINSGTVVTMNSDKAINTGTITVNGTLNCGSNLVSGTGIFTLSSGATLGIGSADGIVTTGSTGNIQVSGTRTFSSSANYIYNGGSAQVTGAGLPSTVNNLTINNSAGVTLTSSTTVNGIMTLMSGTFALSSSQTLSYGVAGILNYNGSALQTTTDAELPTSNGPASIVINNSSGVNLHSSRNIAGTLTLTNGTFAVGANTLTISNPIVCTSGSLGCGCTSSIEITGSGSGINIPGNITDLNNLTISNLNGATLQSSLTLAGILTLTSGNLTTTNSNLLTLDVAGTISGGSSTSFINGPLAKNTNTTATFTFPVGKEGIYKSIGIIPTSTNTTTFKVEYFNTPYSNTTTLGTGLVGVSSLNYCEISRSGSTPADAKVIFSWNILEGVTVPSELRVAHWDGSAWQNMGNSAYTTGPSGTVTSNVVTSFSPFALGSSTANNALPVELTSFISNVSPERNVKLDWITSREINNTGFEVLRKLQTENNWINLGFVKGKGTAQSTANYTFEDKKLNSGKYEYKLKQIDNNGNYKYFNLNNIIEIKLPEKYSISQNYPNPFNPVTKIDFDLPFDSRVRIVVYDMLGREIKTLASGELKQAGFYTVELNAANLASGMYFYRMIANGQDKDFIFTKKMVVLK